MVRKGTEGVYVDVKEEEERGKEADMSLLTWRKLAYKQERGESERGQGGELYSPAPLASLLGYSAEWWIQTVDVIVIVTRVTESHQVRVLYLGTHCTLW